MVDILETITYQIRNCSIDLGTFTSIMNSLGNTPQGLFGELLSNPFQFAEDSLKDKSKQWLQQRVAQFSVEFLKTFLKLGSIF